MKLDIYIYSNEFCILRRKKLLKFPAQSVLNRQILIRFHPIITTRFQLNEDIDQSAKLENL